MKTNVIEDRKPFFSKTNLPDLIFWIMAVILLFLNLGVKAISGSEARWTGIVREMFLSGNFVQPTINFELYFDKPIVSYWLIAIFAFFNKGEVTELLARIPSALAALAALWATRVIAFRLWSRDVAVTASWIFLTIYSLAFWGRLAEADMLNMAFGTLAIAWYIVKRDKTDVFSYFLFGTLCAVGGQTKGLSAIAIPVLVVLTDLVVNKTWKRHLNWRLFAAGILSLLVYFLPFFLIATKSSETFMNGLYQVFRENITRFFNPFDHKGPWYDYFKYLPQLFIPWTPFLVLAFAWACKEWKRLSGDERWLLVSNIVIFTVFSLSGSKRVYYILPILPFCALLTALYLCRKENGFWEKIKVVLLQVYEWVFFIAGFILLVAPLIWHFVKRELQNSYQKVLERLDSLKGTPDEIAKGFATGVAMSFTPFVGFHLLLCIAITKLSGQNGVAAALGTLFGNPWTFPFIWLLTLHLGLLILGTDAPSQPPEFKILFVEMFHNVLELDAKAFFKDIWPVFLPMLVGSMPVYIIVWAGIYEATKRVLLKSAETSQTERNENDTGIGL